MTKDYNIKVLYHPADMAKVDQIEEMMDKYPADILINNAGIQYVCPIDKFPVERWNAIMDINLSAVVICLLLTTPYIFV